MSPNRDNSKRKKPERKAFLLRLPPDLMNQLKTLAARDLRSVNGEIEFLLREAIKRREKED